MDQHKSTGGCPGSRITAVYFYLAGEKKTWNGMRLVDNKDAAHGSRGIFCVDGS